MDAEEGPGGGDQIRLVLPAEPDYGRIARIAASSLALRLGFSFLQIEDLRIAIDEMVILLLRPDGTSTELTIEFTVEPDALVIDARTDRDAPDPIDAEARARFEEIVDGTVDSHRIDDTGHGVHLVKRY